jgi:nitrate/nitrite transport system substrate-binding protein
VLEQILTGTYADGLGSVKTDAKRIDFDPFPYEVVCRVDPHADEALGADQGRRRLCRRAQQVYLATDTARLMKEVGLTPPTSASKSSR